MSDRSHFRPANPEVLSQGFPSYGSTKAAHVHSLCPTGSPAGCKATLTLAAEMEMESLPPTAPQGRCHLRTGLVVTPTGDWQELLEQDPTPVSDVMLWAGQGLL